MEPRDVGNNELKIFIAFLASTELSSQSQKDFWVRRKQLNNRSNMGRNTKYTFDVY